MKGVDTKLLRQRYIPPDIWEDVKLGKFLPVKALPWLGGGFIFGIILALALPINPILKILLVFLPMGAMLIVYWLNLPDYIVKVYNYRKANGFFKAKKVTLEDLINIDTYGTICENKDKTVSGYIECQNVAPWEVLQYAERDRKGDMFGEQVFTSTKNDVSLSVYGICKGEDISILEERLKNSKQLPEALRALEDKRIERHYRIARNASVTKYYISVTGSDQEQVMDVIENVEEYGPLLGGDIVKKLVETHLTPNAKIKRGKPVTLSKSANEYTGRRENGCPDISG